MFTQYKPRVVTADVMSSVRQFESLGGRKGEKSELEGNFQKFGYRMCISSVEVSDPVLLPKDKK